MKKLSIYLFAFVSVSNVFGNFIEDGLLTDYSKPLLMPALCFFFYTHWSSKKNVIFLLTIIALIFSWSGDVFLLFQERNTNYFLLGLASFLMAHIFYMITYYFAQTDMGIPQNKFFLFSRIFILAITGSALLNILWPKLNELTIPVVIYTVIIILMSIFAVLRKDRTTPASFSFIYGGALLFIVSDGMIAITKFLQHFEFFRMYIMLTYLLAQFFIVKGILAHQKAMR